MSVRLSWSENPDKDKWRVIFSHSDPVLSDVAVQWQQNQLDMQQSQQSGGAYGTFDDVMK